MGCRTGFAPDDPFELHKAGLAVFGQDDMVEQVQAERFVHAGVAYHLRAGLVDKQHAKLLVVDEDALHGAFNEGAESFLIKVNSISQ